jgi:opine dehydrogenase
MIQKITVIGAGSTGHAVAGIMSMRGFQVTFHDDERFSSQLDAVKELGFIQLRGKIRGIGTPAKVTTDPAEAVRGAEAIFVHVPADRHEEIARRIAPFVEDGQHIMIIPGNLGAFIFRKVFQEMGVTAKVTLTEKEGNFCPCRLSAPAEVTVGLPLNLKGKVASLPASDTERVLKALEGVVEYSANQNVFEGVINAGNVINHVASTILSTAEIDHKGDKYSLFKYAFTPSVVHCIRKISEERKAVIEAMGMTVHGNPTGMIDKVLHLDEHPEVHVFYEYMDGPNAVDHRYLHEDCGCGSAFALSVAERLGMDMPVLRAFVGVAGALNDRDYIHGGRTLENLGFPKEMSLEDIYKAI